MTLDGGSDIATTATWEGTDHTSMIDYYYYAIYYEYSFIVGGPNINKLNKYN